METQLLTADQYITAIKDAARGVKAAEDRLFELVFCYEKTDLWRSVRADGDFEKHLRLDIGGVSVNQYQYYRRSVKMLNGSVDTARYPVDLLGEAGRVIATNASPEQYQAVVDAALASVEERRATTQSAVPSQTVRRELQDRAKEAGVYNPAPNQDRVRREALETAIQALNKIADLAKHNLKTGPVIAQIALEQMGVRAVAKNKAA